MLESTEEQRIADLDRLRSLLEEVKRRKAMYGGPYHCTTGHAYERIKYENKAMLEKLCLKAVEELTDYNARR